MPPPEKPLLRPRSKPRPKLKAGPSEAKSLPARPARDGTPGGVPLLPQPLSCEASRLCPPPPAPPATVHLSSGRLPTPLIAVSASLLALSAVLLLALLVRWLLRRRRVERYAPQEAPLAPDVDEEESVMGVDSVEAGSVAGQEEDEEDVDGEVHHVWFIRTRGLDERAIAAIAAVVYDAKTKRGVDADGGCAVCLAEFRDGETLRLLPRCAHAFHRGCIDTWLRAHVNCPLCRAPVQVPTSTATVTRPRGDAPANPIPTLGGAQAEEAVLQERAVRRAASMLTLPRREWPDDVSLGAPASASGREEDMTGLAKIRRLLKFSEALDGVAAGRSFSFGASRSCQRLPARSGPSTAAGADGDDVESSR